MPVYRPRTRLVNFRLSEDEYQLLKDFCLRSGARSVSDFARDAVLAECRSNRWERLEGSVHLLETKIDLLMDKEREALHG